MTGLPEDIERVALLGWQLYPRAPRHRAAAFTGAHLRATHDLDQLAAWAREYPGCGWYCVTGRSGIWALDIDQRGAVDGVATLAGLGTLPTCPVVRTGGGGWLAVFRDTGAPLRGQPGCLGPGLDPRRGAQTITLPATRHHATGRPYRWRRAPWDIDPPAAPDWLLTALRPPPERVDIDPRRLPSEYIEARAARVLYRLDCAREGGRNAALNAAAWSLGRLGIPEGMARTELAASAARLGLPADEAKRTITSGLRAGRNNRG